ncbi:MAG: hypothetical protein KAY32_08940 [Candidatus Eisenbacteria sp.]|nr:hypothetical protein [Candidatus Eisenbacteria bacterium]
MRFGCRCRGFLLLALGLGVMLGLHASPAREPGIQGSGHDSQGTRDCPDTLWFGGDDGTGVAYLGGVWDWDTITGDSLQGWRAPDMGLQKNRYFGWVEKDSFIVHGDPVIPMIGDSEGMLWCGVHEDEALCRGFVDGMGYGNHMCQSARSPAVPIDPVNDDIDLAFDFFSESEWGFDYTYVYVGSYGAGGDHLADLELARFDWCQGSYEDPDHFATSIARGTLPAETETTRVELRFASDMIWSDEDGEWPTVAGPFTMDNLSLKVGGAKALEFDFETGPQGWVFDTCWTRAMDWLIAGSDYITTIPEETWQAWTPAGCPLSARALGFFDPQNLPYSPHNFCDRFYFSGPIARCSLGLCEWDSLLVRYTGYLSNWGDNFCSLRIRWGYRYHRLGGGNCWSRPWMSSDWLCENTVSCTTAVAEIPGARAGLPTDWDSLQVAFEFYYWCWPKSETPKRPKCAPLLDDVQVGFAWIDPATLDDGESQVIPPARGMAATCRPNPFLQQTTIHFTLAAATDLRLVVLDATGRIVRSIAIEGLGAGPHAVTWDGLDRTGHPAESGFYWIRLIDGQGAVGDDVAVVRLR